ncbi:SCAN domain-containing protein 3 [Trichonephila clavipes]|nr:SCAN domain-containing protein 3 [Trichonephila clavipes]
MIGGSADIDICKIPLSNDTIHRRIKDMSENIEQNTAKTLANSNFALQVDETTDITGNAQLIAFVRFIHENDIINQFLCCRELPDFTTGKHIFQVISSYLEEIKVSWKSCIGICTDGAPAMTGHLKGFVAHVKELNEDILVTHCFLHREALVTKFLPSDLKIVLEQCVKMVNYIKSRPLKVDYLLLAAYSLNFNLSNAVANIFPKASELTLIKITACRRKRVVTPDEIGKISINKESGDEFSGAKNDDEGGNSRQKQVLALAGVKTTIRTIMK